MASTMLAPLHTVELPLLEDGQAWLASSFTSSMLQVFLMLLGTAVCIQMPRRGAPPVLYGGRSKRLKELLSRMPSMSQPEEAPAMFGGAVMQLIVFCFHQCVQEQRVFRGRYEFEDVNFKVKVDDAELDTEDEILVSWLKRVGDRRLDELPEDAPLVVVCPGLNCSKESIPGTSVYDTCVERGCRVLVHHKRGIGRPVKKPVIHIFGHPSDFQAVLEYAASKYPKAGIHILGYSSGNGLAGSHAALYADSMIPQVKSYCLLVGGANYNTAFAPENSNYQTELLFDKGLILVTKDRMLRKNSEVLKKANPDAFKLATEATKMQDVYDICHRYFSGYSEKQIDYAEAKLNPLGNGLDVMQAIKVPLLWVLTEDDPVMPGGPPKSWLASLEKLDNCVLAMFRQGSHLACYRNWRLERWIDDILGEWLDAFSMDGEMTK
eukprot:TRINITY_DN81497_c0_g1_i1.p1 TRINITY_DN81497_c0_g1~~TRINITY_DN81497_c0_g1_i1.p1  ORF type:complete len:435 (-),score=81.91 TRINITY_DN81497_c0_g1_i1:199-1503(-)